MTTSDFLLERLVEWGFYRIYGYPGDGINGIMGAFDRIGDKLQFIQVRHEEMAAFMACAHAKFTGEIGICLATSGPGAIHLLNGLYDAKMDHVPVVAIVGQAATTALGGSYQQEVDLQVLLQDVTEYVTRFRARRRCATSSTAPCARQRACAPSPASSCRKTFRRACGSRAAARAQQHEQQRGILRARRRSGAARSAARGGYPQRRRARRDDGRARRRQCDGRGARGCRSLGGGHRKSAARERRRSRRFAIRDGHARACSERARATT